MTFEWSREAELCLASIGSVAGMLDDKSRRKLSIHEKESARDVVTETDIAVERRLREALVTSKYPIVGEEMASDDAVSAKDGCWFVDPIDGTANFLVQIPFYGTSAGFVSNFEFVVGAVVFPALKELYFVSDCGDAYLNAARIVAKSVTPSESLIGMSFSGKAVDPGGRAKEFGLFGSLNDKSRGCLRTGSAALNVCYVASGKLQVAVGLHNRIWDVAGALAIARAAGCELFCNVDWASNRISYVVGASPAVDVVAAEVAGTLGAGLGKVRLRDLKR